MGKTRNLSRALNEAGLIKENDIQDAAISQNKIADNAITTAKIQEASRGMTKQQVIALSVVLG